MSRAACFVLSAAAVALAACDPGPEAPQAADEIVTRTPRIEATAIEGYDRLGGDVADVALLPNADPPLGRGLVALETGGFVSINFAAGTHHAIDGPRVATLAAAPDFQLRGSAAPLLLASGGELSSPRAWVFLVDDGENDAELVDLPIDPIAPGEDIRGMCLSRETEAYLDVLVLTADAAQTWRVSDRGGDALAAQMTDETPLDRPGVDCALVAGALATVSESGATRLIENSPWGFSDGADIASVELDDGAWTLVARPSAGRVSVLAPGGAEVEAAFVPGLNTPTVSAPEVLEISPANFGASFNVGVVLAAEQDRINVMALDAIVADAKAALNPSSTDSSASN